MAMPAREPAKFAGVQGYGPANCKSLQSAGCTAPHAAAEFCSVLAQAQRSPGNGRLADPLGGPGVALVTDETPGTRFRARDRLGARARPADDARGGSEDEGVRRNVARDDRARADEGVRADANAAHDRGVRSDGDAAAHG